LVLNALVAVRLSTHAEETRHTLSLHLARRPANLAVLGLGLFLLGAILTYGFVENVLAVLP
ncbi:MAG: hypothetical protein HKN04_03045, partial [Rhodothermaceae bacterium]|nr:hypothetical protein [Rhodothermaceae bacterium]